MGIWQMFALVSMLKSNLYSVYPKLGTQNVREGLIMHRGCEPKYSVAIMWTSNRDDMNETLDSKQFRTTDTIRRRKRLELSDNFGFETSTIFQELETESVPTVNLQEPEPEPTIQYQVCYCHK